MSKKIFLDTNVVADIIDAKRASHDNAIKLMQKLIYDDFIVCISEDMLSTLFCISKEKTQTLAFFKNVIFQDWEILNFSKKILNDGVELSLKNSLDLEDVFQCLCAKQNGCNIVITNDSKSYNCGLEIFSIEQFINI